MANDRKRPTMKALKEFLSTPDRPITMDEIKQLSADERRELADLLEEANNR